MKPGRVSDGSQSIHSRATHFQSFATEVLVELDESIALAVECQHVVHPPSLKAGGILPRAECGRDLTPLRMPLVN